MHREVRVTEGVCEEVRVWSDALREVRGAGMRVVAQAPPEVPEAIVAALAAAAAPLGYVAIDAHLDVPEDERRRLWHRHVVLVHRGDPSPASIRWIRELAMASPRAHAVVMIHGLVDRVHESGVAASGWRSVPWRVGHWRNRRPHVVQPRGVVRRVLAYGRRQLAAGPGLLARSQLVAAMADAWMSEGSFDAATGALAGVDVECQLRGVPVPSWVRERQAEVACWLGQWSVAALHAADAAHVGWITVVACARRDWDTVRALPAAAPEMSPGWSALVAALRAAARGDAPGVCAAVGELQRSEEPPRWRDVLALECLRMVGADDTADRWRRRWERRARGPAESVLWRHATRASDHGTTEELDAAVRRLGADGIRRWGMRRANMQMWAGVSSLLQLVHEADDAGSALRQGCRWAREYTGVDVVGVISEAGQVLACDPDEPRRVAGSCSAGDFEAVRFGGTRIGRVVMLGVARDAAEAAAVAAALATACAPAVRARLDELLVARAGEVIAGDLLGISPPMAALRDTIARAAASSFPVLIEGESGTGKELVARAVHRLSPRRDRRWAAVNCAALTDELLEAELFGHTRGAFTGAVGPRAGLLEDAHEGTLFLDEVAELSPRGQAKLLRVLQEGEIRRVGENQSRRVDVRVVTATNRPLEAAVRESGYREDLVFRLAVIRLRVPPLRDRIEDVPLLAHAFWQAAAARVATRAMLTPEAVAALCRYRWPGNVRELQNVIAALAVAGPSRGRVCARHVATVLAERAAGVSDAPVSLAVARRLGDRRVVTAALARHAGRRAAAARELGVSRQGLAKLIARLNV